MFTFRMITKSDLIARFGSAAALAAAAGVTRQAVQTWRERIPVERCPAIARASQGKYTVHDLRPDVFGPACGEVPGLSASERAA